MKADQPCTVALVFPLMCADSAHQGLDLGTDIPRLCFAFVRERGVRKGGIQIGTWSSFLWLATHTSATMAHLDGCKIVIALAVAYKIYLDGLKGMRVQFEPETLS